MNNKIANIITLTVKAEALRTLFEQTYYLSENKSTDELVIYYIPHSFVITDKYGVADVIDRDNPKWDKLDDVLAYGAYDESHWRANMENDVRSAERAVQSFLDWATQYESFHYVGSDGLKAMATALVMKINNQVDDELVIYEMAGCPWELISYWIDSLDSLTNQVNGFIDNQC